MGTNYFMSVNPCPCCGRAEEQLHIGKSSGGWVFSLNTHPENGITGLDDWQAAWVNNPIKDEYGESISVAEMERIITARKPWKDGGELMRHTVDDNFCLAHGDGTYDLMRGEFS